MFRNYADQALSATNFYDTSATALMASTVYRLSLLAGVNTYIPMAEKSLMVLAQPAASSSSSAVQNNKRWTLVASSSSSSSSSSSGEHSSPAPASTQPRSHLTTLSPYSTSRPPLLPPHYPQTQLENQLHAPTLSPKTKFSPGSSSAEKERP